MKRISIRSKIFSLLITAGLIVSLSGCNQTQAPASKGTADIKPVKLGVLPIEDNFPLYLAEQEGIFTNNGVKVELVNFASAAERDTAIQAGQIDGEVADLLAVALLKKIGTEVKIASIGLGATPQEGRFAILSAPNSKILKPADLKNSSIGISENSIIDYVTDQMLKDKGVDTTSVKKLSIPKMPVRLDMLLTNQIDAACLPDPLASLAEAKGAHLVVDDTYRNISQTVILFRSKSIQDNPAGVKAVVKAYGDASQALTQNPEKYRSLFIEKAQIPDPLKQTYKMPAFSKLRLPTEDEVNSVMQWMVEKKLLTQAYTYNDLVDFNLLPK